MGATPSEEMPGKLLRMFPGKRVAADTDLLVATAHKVENIEHLAAAETFLDMLDAADGYLELVRGGVLNRIKVECWIDEVGVAFEKWLRGIGIRVSTAEAQIRLYNNLVESGCSQADWDLLGWPKLRLIAPFLTEEVRAQWIDLAESKPLPELVGYVQKKQATSSARANVLRESIKRAGYRKALHVIEELWPELDIEVCEP